jgi:hypothetical protein
VCILSSVKAAAAAYEAGRHNTWNPSLLLTLVNILLRCLLLSGATGGTFNYASGTKSATTRSQTSTITDVENIGFDVGRK